MTVPSIVTPVDDDCGTDLADETDVSSSVHFWGINSIDCEKQDQVSVLPRDLVGPRFSVILVGFLFFEISLPHDV